MMSKCDLDGLPLDSYLTGAEALDSQQFETLFDDMASAPRAVLGDKGYDSMDNRDAAKQKGCVPVNPRRSNSTEKGWFFPKKLYKLRTRIAQFIGGQNASSVSPFCEKTAQDYAVIFTFVSV